MKILITGGCGFIGTNLIDLLLRSAEHELVILDNLSTGNIRYVLDVLKSNGWCRLSDLKFIKGDIRNSSTVKEACKGVNAVVHLAAHAGVIPSVEDPFFDADVNVLGTLNLLDASHKSGVQKFIFASSNAPLGTQNPPMNESKAPGPLSPYGASKLSGEGYCSAFFGSYGLKTIVLRFSNAYGPLSLHKNSVVSRFIKDGLSLGRLTIYGDGAQTRDFIHAEDLARAIIGVLGSDLDEIYGETFHLGNGTETKIIDLASIIRDLLGNGVEIIFEPERAGEIKRNYSDITKARRMLDFDPEIGIEEGAARVFDWFMKQGRERVISAVAVSGSD